MEKKLSTMENLVTLSKDFWLNKKVFITGHTGFKGTWLSIWLASMGAIVKGYALEPNTNPNIFYKTRCNELVDTHIGDIRNIDELKKSINDYKPEIVFHLAAQPLVLQSYIDPIGTIDTNIIGTANVLEASIRCPSVRAVINVTSDKCYENKEWYWGYRENDPMGGFDPYSASKGCAELITSAYRKSFYNKADIGLASVRAGNVIGGGDWSDDRLIPDILKSVTNSKELQIRNPDAIRPWQHVLEPLYGYLLLAEKLYQDPKKFNDSWNFGPYEESCKSVEWIVTELSKFFNTGFKVVTDKEPLHHEARLLKLDISKSKNMLGWEPRMNLEEALHLIVEWHNSFISNEDLQNKTIEQIYIFQK